MVDDNINKFRKKRVYTKFIQGIHKKVLYCYFRDGTTLYHSGDTSIVAEMEIYGRLYPVDVAFIPIFSQCMIDYI